ncbi:YkvA family protein [Myxosarcina sp. GI1]|uniref:YkvA family protein n=1 Tax=Myxosarcina sp. GI1 TaxID=1541065 RepID=UPI001C100407|nr:DUF1232 domain-containing protein [Myxosarcina sp. GI1]
MMKQWRQKARELKQETYVLNLACKDARTPWYVKFIASCAIAYALSPIDLIPDFIPVLGLLDDLILLPLVIVLLIKLIPTEIMDDCRRQAEATVASDKNQLQSWNASVIIIAIWSIAGVILAFWIHSLIR